MGLLTHLCNIGNVLLLGYFLTIVQKGQVTNELQFETAFTAVFLLFIVMILNAYTKHHHGLMGGLLAIKIKGSVIGLIYKKLIHTKLTHSQSISMGKLNNII